MTATHLEDIVVFPMSGYINRLQTIASAAVLAEQTNARLRICWIPFALAPSPAEAVFDSRICSDLLISEATARREFGLSVDEIPLYVHSKGAVVSLRGADRGEQALMQELQQVIDERSPTTLAIVSGGSFFRDAPSFTMEDFRLRKSNFYRTLAFHPEIETSVQNQLAQHPGQYLGLHLRYTDRSRQAPLQRSIRKALKSQSAETGITSVFVAADSNSAREHWVGVCREMGLDPWFVEHPTIAREDPLSAHPALIDWNLLGHATRLVYFTASSFAAEAVVMSGSWDSSSGLHPNRLRAGVVHLDATLRAGFRRLSRK
jgi:hypothetical protein